MITNAKVFTADDGDPLPSDDGSSIVYVSDGTILKKVGNEWSRTSEQASTGSGSSYTHIQSSPAAEWTITHGLGYNPSVTVVDSAGSTVVGDVTYVSIDTIKITFSGGFSGRAYLS